MPMPDDEKSKLLLAMQTAGMATMDVEDDLVRLEALKDAMTVDPAIKVEYEILRDRLTATLRADGPRLFMAPDGKKYLAMPVLPEGVEVDKAALIALVTEGVLTEDELDKLAPRKVDKAVLTRYAGSGKIPANVLKRIARVVPKTGHVRLYPIDAIEDGEL